MAIIQSIYRYPIKGLSPEALSRVLLAPGEAVPGDRIYAIENGPSGFDRLTQPYRAKTHFLMLMKNERLAALRTEFDHASHVLTITPPTPAPPRRKRGEGNIASLPICNAPRAARRSSATLRNTAPTSCAGRRKSCTRPATVSPTSPARWSRSSTSPR